MDSFYNFIIKNATKGKIDRETAVQMITMMRQGMVKDSEDIAIIGIAAKLPGADNVKAFWENILCGIDCTGNFPESRQKGIRNYLLRKLCKQDKDLKYLSGAYLNDIENFDYGFFKMSPKEASLMDPSQRLFLQTAWEAIEDAGYGGKKLVGSKTGVYLGYAGSSDYQRMIFDIEPSLMPVSIVGNIAAITPTRISYLLDLKGPTMVVDTACSASAVAIHIACQSLRNGDCTTAIAGGVRLNLLPWENEYLTLGFESSDGRTRTFYENADGAGWGEGVATVLLKPLSAAKRDGDNIYAVIKGIAVNQDGASIGITAPNSTAQANVIMQAWENAGINPETISYVEAHGTATNLGDPLEIEGLQKAFRKYTDKNQFCAISAIKSNVGHLYECAGMAGLIKAVLSLKNKKIPGTINFSKPNKKINFSGSPIYVNVRTKDWEKGEHPRRCGVSAFGLSGTNCHMILEEYTDSEAVPDIQDDHLNVLAISAKSINSLKELVRRYDEFISGDPELSLNSLCYTANVGRGHYSHRLALVFRDIKDLKDKLFALNGVEFDKINNEWAFYGEHKVLSANKELKGEHEIRESDRVELTQTANSKLDGLTASDKNNEELFKDLCRLYIHGASIKWDDLYKGEKIKKTSLPVYPFEPSRCWLEAPEIEEKTGEDLLKGLYYTMRWQPEALGQINKREDSGAVLILKGSALIGEEICETLRQRGRRVIEVQAGDEYAKLDDLRYTIKGSQQEYDLLVNELREEKLSQIIHLFTLGINGETDSLDKLEEHQRMGVHSLAYLAKALIKAGIKNEIDVALISEYSKEVTGDEDRIIPENAPLYGIGKVINKEQPNLSCRYIDIDEAVSIDDIMVEVDASSECYAVAYRKGERYVEAFDALKAENTGSRITIKEQGIYVITGGTGGIGLEIAKHLASQNKVNLALLNRTGIPERDKWDAILKGSSEENTKKKIQAIREIESTGATVKCFKADVSNMEEVKAVLDEVRDTYGSINGIIHSAGVALDYALADKEEEVFRYVLSPKIQGTWILDRLTRSDDMDFFVMCSSVATMFSMFGQGDYAAANSYMDSFAAYRSRQGKKTLTINWVAWKETGMAVNSGFVVDTIFKTLPTAQGIEGFVKLLGTDERRALVGEINYDGIGLSLLERSGVKLSDDLAMKVFLYKEQSKAVRAKLSSEAGESSAQTGTESRNKGNYSEIEKEIAWICKETLGFEEIDVYDNFLDLGADSIMLMMMQEDIEKHFPGKVTVMDMFKCSSVSKLAEFIAGKEEKTDAVSDRKLDSNKEDDSEVAIIGIALKFPMADNIDEYWNNIKNGLDCITTLPESRQEDVNRYIGLKNIPLNAVEYDTGSYIEGIDKFDYSYFRFPPKEAGLTDPNHRMFLQTAWEAIEDAGYGGKKIVGTNTGIYLGFASSQIYNLRYIEEGEPSSQSMAIVGNTSAVATGRVSYLFDLKGPSMVVDTACSASLLAVHLACRSIRMGDCDMAIAGGVKINLLPVHPKGAPKGIGMESADGRARTFDDNSDGTGSGEGVGAILLKPLKKALADRDNIYAVIKGSASNQDGSSAGVTAPNPAAQEDVIVKAWEDAGIDPETISYIEAHGTGTQLGDPIEIEGIQSAFERYTSKKQFCAVGSVKTNIAHLSEAAGMAGLIKAVLALKNKEIPPSRYLNRPNRKIGFGSSPVYINTVARKWESDGYPRRCGVSGFGMSGTNCHVVLEEYTGTETTANNSVSDGLNVLAISAKSDEALRGLIRKYKSFVNSEKDFVLRNVCFTANTGREHYNHRLAIVTQGIEDLKWKLEVLEMLGPDAVCESWANYGRHKVVSKDKGQKEIGDITEEYRVEICREASEKLEAFKALQTSDEDLLGMICGLYAKGASLKWEDMYDGENLSRISIPTYPFEQKRCWVDIPEYNASVLEVTTGEQYHADAWVKENLEGKAARKDSGSVLIFKDENGIGDELADRFRNKGMEVIDVKLGEVYDKSGQSSYSISGTQEDYSRLFEDIKLKELTKVIHLLTMSAEDEANTLEDLEKSLKSGVYSLFYIVKAIEAAGISRSLDMVIISRCAESVSKDEEHINPWNMSLFGLGRVVRLEHPGIMCRCIDTDNYKDIDSMMAEIDVNTDAYQVAYRKGERYIREFREFDVEYTADRKVEITEAGVYIITGGTGGMGIEISRYLASRKKVNIALINRSEMPERYKWDDIIKGSNRNDKKTVQKIKSIMEIESLGAEVVYYSADVSDMEKMKTIVDGLRERYGRINGIVHAAGTAGGGFLFKKEETAFKEVLDPKVYGTWVLDKLTQADELDFFVMFSSVASLFPGKGQSDYAAGNSYLDSYAQYRNSQGRKTLTINWAAWRDTGMAVEYGVNVDGIFKVLPTPKAIYAFDEILNKDISRVFIGEFNYGTESMAALDGAPVKLSRKIREAVSQSVERLKAKVHAKQKSLEASVKLKGRADSEYSEVEGMLARIYSQVLGFIEIDIYDNFFEMGGDSRLLSQMHELVELQFPGKVKLLDLFEYTSISKLSNLILSFGEVSKSEDTGKKVKKVQKSLKDGEVGSGDIAIIGMAARFPGARNIGVFWENILCGIDCTGNFPESRKKGIHNYLLRNFGEQDKELSYLSGAYLDDIESFDYRFFRMSPKEASLMDPAQRLFMQTVWEAIEEAGYGGEKLVGSKTGVYLGYAASSDYQRMIFDTDPSQMSISVVGNIAAMTPTRISYLLDLKGPTMVVDTACSASAVAIHLACQSLKNGDCSTAIAGGMRINMFPMENDYLKLGVESQGGRTRTFDDNADGAGWGEGVAAVLLKPLMEAVRDGDNIYAVIKGTALNQDGTSIGITAPNSVAQSSVITQAWENAGVNPETISYIEAHGTATNLGDPLEIEGLQKAFRRYTDKNQFCAISAIKSNVGHLYECAAMAGFIKAALSLKHRKIPGAINFNKPNKKIDFNTSPVYVNTRTKDWEEGEYPRRCGVSAFGLSGTNCHIVLEEYVGSEDAADIRNDSFNVLALSAKSDTALKELVSKYDEFISSESDVSIRSLCHTANTGRGHYSYRLALVFKDGSDLKQKLCALEGMELYRINNTWAFYGEHKVISGNKESKGENEIRESERVELTRAANDRLKQLPDAGKDNQKELEDICKLYIQGAAVKWDDMYEGEELKRVSIPVYPFERNRCWIGYPESKENTVVAQSQDLYYTMRWQPENLVNIGTKENKGSVLILKDSTGRGAKLSEVFISRGRRVIEVESGEKYSKISDSSYVINGSEEEYQKLINELQREKLSQIIHLFTLNIKEEANSLDKLEEYQNLGVYSLVRLVKALEGAGIKDEIDVVLISEYAKEVTGDEDVIIPENATLYGIGRVIVKEHPNLSCRYIDVDEATHTDSIIAELDLRNDCYAAAYRKGGRYVEVFAGVNIANTAENQVEIKEQGVYVITGGVGGIGLEMARYLASEKKVNLALLNRSGIPERASWDEILERNSEENTKKKIQAIKEIESKGVRVELCKTDIANIEEVKTVLDELRVKYGRINGVIHGAGVSMDGPSAGKAEEFFRYVLSPKVQGTWILDKLTREDDLDFFVMFSSVATIFSMFGQGDYAAANSYLDSYCAYRSKQGKRTLTINWTTWKETGMAFNSGHVVDTIFKALPTSRGIEGFKSLIGTDEKRALVGEINYEGVGLHLLERSHVKLSQDITEKMALYKSKSKGAKGVSSPRSAGSSGEVKLTGRDSGKYTGIEKEIAGICKDILGFSDLDVYDNFFEMGADSLLLMKIQAEIEKKLPVKIAVVDMFEYSTISKLAEYIVSRDEKAGARLERKAQVQTESDGDIAIIGIALRFPMANNIDDFWNNIKSGLDCVTTVPESRQEDLKRYIRFKNYPMSEVEYDVGSYIEGIDKFDYSYFRMSPKEASLTDPNHRMFLQTAWEAIEDAGYGGKKILGTNTGIYLGFASTQIYSLQLINDVDPASRSTSMVGNTAAVATGRVSYLYDLKGPSMVVDTACSASLVTVHLACKSIRTGDCDMAIAGGVKLNLLPVHKKGSPTGIGMESSDGRARTFDDNSDGTGSGEGVAAILLKPLKKAVEDRDNIYAVIKGSATNQDGSSAGITAPNPAAQEEVIIKAWANAGIDPETISYIEAHGTGTQLGDPIEIKGIQSAFEKYTSKRQFCAVGSLKTNIAHLSEAAGIAGLIKAVLALRNKEIPPNAFMNRPNRKINFGDSPVYVNTVARKWEPDGYPRRCGVSGFGMSGTNCHVVLEEYTANETDMADSIRDSGLNVLAISAKSEEALKNLIHSYRSFADSGTNPGLRDLCYTANTGREHYSHRLAVLVNSIDDLKQKIKRLDTLGLDEIHEVWAYYGKHKVVSEDKGQKEDGEITEKHRLELCRECDMKLEHLMASKEPDETLLGKICSLYANGAAVKWDDMYQDENPKKVSLPTYPFEQKRCWLEIPEFGDADLEVVAGEQYHAATWVKDSLKAGTVKEDSGTVLIFKDTTGIGDELALRLKDKGREVIEVKLGESYEKYGECSYSISGTQEDYDKLFHEIKHKDMTKLLHLFTVTEADEAGTIKKQEENQKHGAYSLFYITKAMASAGISREMDTVMISKYAAEVTGDEERINPWNMTLFGLGKVVRLENSNIMCRCIDIDDFTDAEGIMDEITANTGAYHAAYRNGERYIEEVREFDLDYAEDRKIEVREGGVYIITGGTGGMGIEISKYLASKKKVTIALINRSEMPGRDKWNELLKGSSRKDKKTIQKIKSIREIEALGAEVIYYSADVSDMGSMKAIVDELREKYGRINGIVHAAGLAGGGFLFNKEELAFNEVLHPKVYGTWILDRITEEDNLDFFVMCSSIASVFPGKGQSDYAAANAYLDSYAAYRNRKGKRTLSINWVAWRDTGMAVDYGVNVDSTFKVLPTPKAIRGFDGALNKNISRILVGELNYGTDFMVALDNAPVRLSQKIRASVNQSLERMKAKIEAKQKSLDASLKLKGRANQEYSGVESKLARIYSQILGFSEIDIYDNFFEMGGDSILLSQMHELLELEFPGKIRLLDLFEYTSISRLSSLIFSGDEESKSPDAGKKVKKADKLDNDIEKELDNILNLLEDGDLSIDEVMDSLKDIK